MDATTIIAAASIISAGLTMGIGGHWLGSLKLWTALGCAGSGVALVGIAAGSINLSGTGTAAYTAGFAAELRELLTRCAERGVDPAQLERVGRLSGRREWAAAGRFATARTHRAQAIAARQADEQPHAFQAGLTIG